MDNTLFSSACSKHKVNGINNHTINLMTNNILPLFTKRTIRNISSTFNELHLISTCLKVYFRLRHSCIPNNSKLIMDLRKVPKVVCFN